MEQKKKKQPNPFIQFSGLGLQLLITIYLFNLLGNYVDTRFEVEEQWGTKLITLLGVVLATILVIRQVQNLSK